MLNNIFMSKFSISSFISDVSLNKKFSKKDSNRKITDFNISTLTKVFPPVFYYSCQGAWIVKIIVKSVLPLLIFLKMYTPISYKQLIDLIAIDHSKRKQRFEVIYQLLSLIYNHRLSVSVSVSEGIALDSVISVFSSAGWYERETWDRFGIFFRNHPDLRRRLIDYGFKGHPLRKDFPLIGFTEICYNAYRGRVVYEHVSLPQEYRIFILDNSWKNII